MPRLYSFTVPQPTGNCSSHRARGLATKPQQSSDTRGCRPFCRADRQAESWRYPGGRRCCRGGSGAMGRRGWPCSGHLPGMNSRSATSRSRSTWPHCLPCRPLRQAWFRIIAQQQIICLGNFSVMAGSWSRPHEPRAAACPRGISRSPLCPLTCLLASYPKSLIVRLTINSSDYPWSPFTLDNAVALKWARMSTRTIILRSYLCPKSELIQ
jgi:hypothetical protein